MIRVGYILGDSTRPQNYWKVDTKTFKGGEVNVVLPLEFLDYFNNNHRVEVLANLADSDGVMAFFLTVDAMRRINPQVKIQARIPYLPYARQDRKCNKGEAVSVAVFAELVNMMKLDVVHLLDPHSDVAAALIKNSIVETQQSLLLEILSWRRLNIKTDNLWLIAPDAGAVKKTKALSDFFTKAHSINAEKGFLKGYMTASKSRNLETMEIVETRFDDVVLGRNLLVVDDICDGGRTFIELGKELRARGCGELSLLVTHGIFSYGVDQLMEIYDRVYTTDSFHPDEYSEIRKYTKTLVSSEGLSRFHWFQC